MPQRDSGPVSQPVFQILLSLVDADLHGYALIQDIRARTEGEVDLTASTLYGAIKRMVADRLIAEVAPSRGEDDPRRRYYRITRLGRDTARAEAARLDRLTAMARAKRLLPALRAASAAKHS
jgi:DNA-binding PadR family transcriptional regulator